MGVYINMEMPKDCLKCPFCLFADGLWKCLVDGSHADFGGTCRPSLCPLVPVPEPHGRLIDADAVTSKDGPYEYDEWCKWALEQYQNAPTIIPAEEGE